MLWDSHCLFRCPLRASEACQALATHHVPRICFNTIRWQRVSFVTKIPVSLFGKTCAAQLVVGEATPYLHFHIVLCSKDKISIWSYLNIITRPFGVYGNVFLFCHAVIILTSKESSMFCFLETAFKAKQDYLSNNTTMYKRLQMQTKLYKEEKKLMAFVKQQKWVYRFNIVQIISCLVCWERTNTTGGLKCRSSYLPSPC